MNVNRAVLFVGCFSIGIIAGLRSLTAPAVVSWAARLGWLNLSGSWLSFLGCGAGGRSRRDRWRFTDRLPDVLGAWGKERNEKAARLRVEPCRQIQFSWRAVGPAKIQVNNASAHDSVDGQARLWSAKYKLGVALSIDVHGLLQI
jgi:hypothetical protein